MYKSLTKTSWVGWLSVVKEGEDGEEGSRRVYRCEWIYLRDKRRERAEQKCVCVCVGGGGAGDSCNWEYGQLSHKLKTAAFLVPPFPLAYPEARL